MIIEFGKIEDVGNGISYLTPDNKVPKNEQLKTTSIYYLNVVSQGQQTEGCSTGLFLLKVFLEVVVQILARAVVF